MIRGKQKGGIKRKIVTSILVVGILPLILGISLTYLNGRKSLRISIGDKFQEIAKQTANKVDMFIEHEIMKAKALALSPDIREAVVRTNSYTRATTHLKNHLDLHKEEYVEIFITDERGIIIVSTKEVGNIHKGNEGWWQFAFNRGKGRLFISNFYFDQEKGEYLMDMAVPLMEEKGERAIGVIKFVIRNLKLFQMIKEIQIGDTGHAMLITSDKVIFICPIFPSESHRITDSVIKKIGMSEPGWTIVEDNAHGGKNAISGFAPVQNTYRLGSENFNGKKWYIFISQNPEETYAVIYTLLWRVFVYGLLLIGIIAMMGYFASYRIVAPIQVLQEGAELIGQGNLDHRLSIRTNDEIEQLAKEFNNMATKLKESYSILEQKVEERTRELKEAQARLIQNEKVSSMGQVAAGIGHELRNPLGVIRNSIYYLKGKINKEDPKLIKHISIIEREISNSDKILSDMLNFARPPVPTLRPSDINRLIEEVIETCNIYENIKAIRELDQRIEMIPLDKDLMRQVFVNVILNAIEAMPEGGELRVLTKKEDGSIRIEFIDTGRGIEEENLVKVFQPFFTTKAKGIGLGLAVSKRIIEQHEGSIDIRSTTGKGTAVAIRLPM